MLYLSKLRARLRAFFRKSRLEDEMSEELRFHVERQIEDHIKAGMAPQEARYAALRAFGGVELVKEECRDARGLRIIDDLGRDLRYGLRMLRRSPGFTIVAMVTLALGIGANTAIFSLIDAVLLRMLPVRDPRQLVELSRPGGRTLSHPFFEYIRDHNDVFSGVFTVASGRYEAGVPLGEGAVYDVRYSLVSSGYFEVLGVVPVLGRALDERDLMRADGAVIGYGLWERAFGRDPGVLGRNLRIGGRPYTIVGVAPPEFLGVAAGQPDDIWLPITRIDRQTLENPVAFVLRIMARLKPGVTERQARANVDVLARQLREEWKLDWQPAIEVTPAGGGLTQLRRRFSRPLAVLMSLVGLVLLIASVNVANLLLARAAARQKEMAVRLSIGAGRARLLRQLLTESILLAGSGGALGLLFASWAQKVLVRFISTAVVPVDLSFDLDYRVLGFTSAASLCTGILFGLAPALAATRLDLTPMLKGGVSSAGGERARLRPGRLLIAGQVAVSSVLLVGALLFARSLHNLNSLDAGFNPQKIALLRAELADDGPRGVDPARLYEQVLERLSALPGVQSVALSSETLFQGNTWTEAVIAPGYHARPGEDRDAVILVVSRGFFKTMQTPVLRGRDFGPQDHENTPRVAVVNEAMAQHYFPGTDAIGRTFMLDSRDFPGPLAIVGVVRDAKYRSLRQPAPRIVYLPMRQAPVPLGMATIEVRTAADPEKVTDVLWREVQNVNRLLRVGSATTQARLVESTIVQERLLAHLSGFFGVLAALLVSLGLYGVTSYAVSQRIGEIGIRLALGAQRRDVLRLVLGESLALVASGVLLGLPAAFGLSRLVESLFFGVSGSDPITLALAASLLLAVGMLSASLPAHRAARVDPMAALRYE